LISASDKYRFQWVADVFPYSAAGPELMIAVVTSKAALPSRFLCSSPVYPASFPELRAVQGDGP
jgi:hypothetical protein